MGKRGRDISVSFLGAGAAGLAPNVAVAAFGGVGTMQLLFWAVVVPAELVLVGSIIYARSRGLTSSTAHTDWGSRFRRSASSWSSGPLRPWTPAAVRKRAEAKLTAIEAKVAALEAMRAAIHQLLDSSGGAGSARECSFLDALDGGGTDGGEG